MPGGEGGGEGTFKKISTGVLVSFFEFEIGQIVMFMGVAQNDGYFWELKKLALFFGVNWKFALFFFEKIA